MIARLDLYLLYIHRTLTDDEEVKHRNRIAEFWEHISATHGMTREELEEGSIAGPLKALQAWCGECCGDSE